MQDGEDVPNGATLRRGAAVRDTCAELFDSVGCIIGTKGRKKNERGLPHGERVAVSEGNVAENMTVPRKADRANRLDYKATAATMNDCTATATLSALSITTTRKVSPQRQLLKRKSRLFITNRRQDISIFLTYDTGIEYLLYRATCFLLLFKNPPFQFDFQVATRGAITILSDFNRGLSVESLVLEEIFNEFCENFYDFFGGKVKIHLNFHFLFFFFHN